MDSFNTANGFANSQHLLVSVVPQGILGVGLNLCVAVKNNSQTILQTKRLGNVFN